MVSFGLVWGILAGGCAKQSDDDMSCPVPPTEQIAGSSGSALVFKPDPAMAAKNSTLSPHEDLDPYRTEVQLSRLTGKGILAGQYVDVRTKRGLKNCGEQYGALSPTNEFKYSEKDPRFQEAMAYYFGDSYQSALDDAGVEVARKPIHVVAHCMADDKL